MKDHKWFSNYEDWVRYVSRYMMNAKREEGVAQITMKNSKGEYIACWQKDGCGEVYESRSKQRLAEDINKLK